MHANVEYAVHERVRRVMELFKYSCSSCSERKLLVLWGVDARNDQLGDWSTAALQRVCLTRLGDEKRLKKVARYGHHMEYLQSGTVIANLVCVPVLIEGTNNQQR